jgi:hypothetical protein
VTLDDELGVDVEAADLGHGIERPRGERVDHSQGRLSGALAEQVDAAGRGAVAASQGWELERVGVLVHLGVERAAELDQQLGDALGGAVGDLGHVVRGAAAG